jgi:hypothetical protein
MGSPPSLFLSQTANHSLPSISTSTTAYVLTILQSAIVKMSSSICGTLMRAQPHSASSVHHHGEQDTVVYAVSGLGSLVSEGGKKVRLILSIFRFCVFGFAVCRVCLSAVGLLGFPKQRSTLILYLFDYSARTSNQETGRSSLRSQSIRKLMTGRRRPCG